MCERMKTNYLTWYYGQTCEPGSVVGLTLRLLISYIYIYIYIYIYDISSLRVNDLTLILLTWRKW